MMNTAVRSLFAFIIPVRQVDKRYVKLNSEWRKSMNIITQLIAAGLLFIKAV